MDMNLREILENLYNHKIKPDEAQWEITKLINGLTPNKTTVNICKTFVKDFSITSDTTCKICGLEKWQH